MNPIKMIDAHRKARILKQFDKTEYGRTLRSFKDKYKGCRCFFIGNGPSLKAEDLTTLLNHGETTFAFNRIFNIFDQTKWRPDFYMAQDEKMLSGCADTVTALDLPVKLIPIQLKWYENIDIGDALYFNMDWRLGEGDDKLDFSDEINKCVYASRTGMYTASQFAAYMGFKEIIFIGVDHHFRISQNSNGEIVVDNNVKDYFSEKYNEDKDKLYIPNTEKSTLTYIYMKEMCDKRGICIRNATRGGMLDVFERVDFDSLF